MHHLTLSQKLTAGLGALAILAATYPASLNATTVTGTPAPQSMPMIEQEQKAAEQPAPQDSKLVIKEAGAMDIWLTKLAHQESRNKAHLKVLDVNGLYSYGCLQFQEGTFRAYALKYGLISPTTPTESRIYDCALQKKIAKLMLAEDYSNWRAWYTSVQMSSVGFPPKPVKSGT